MDKETNFYTKFYFIFVRSISVQYIKTFFNHKTLKQHLLLKEMFKVRLVNVVIVILFFFLKYILSKQTIKLFFFCFFVEKMLRILVLKIVSRN
jgi:hypothetical protein